MLIDTFALTVALPPLAFGPVLPPTPFAPPLALVGDIHDLGRIQGAKAPRWPVAPAVDPRSLRPAREPYLVNRAVDTILFLGAAVAGRATWTDNRSRFEAGWVATPVLILPQIPVLGPTPP